MSSSIIRVKNSSMAKDSKYDLNWVWIASFSGPQGHHGYLPYNPEGYAFYCSEHRSSTVQQHSTRPTTPRVGGIRNHHWKSSEFPLYDTAFSRQLYQLFSYIPLPSSNTHSNKLSLLGWFQTIILTFPLLLSLFNCHSGGFNETGPESQWPISHLLPGVPSPSWRHRVAFKRHSSMFLGSVSLCLSN